MTSPIDLASLADCKAWLGVTTTTDDAMLSALITAISQAILADLGRAIVPATYAETFEAGASSVPLRQWPVTEILGCTVGGIPIGSRSSSDRMGYILDTTDAAPPGRMQRLSVSVRAFGQGLGPMTVTYRAGYEIRGESATVPAVTPYAIAAQAPYGAWATDTGITGSAGSYTVAAGTYTFDSAAAGIPVMLNYGYVPADLARAALEWVADRYAARTRIGQSAKTLGGQETTSFIVKAMPDIVSRLLQPYRRVGT